MLGAVTALSTEPSARASNVKAIHVHPAFNSGNSLEHDVALIHLGAPLAGYPGVYARIAEKHAVDFIEAAWQRD